MTGPLPDPALIVLVGAAGSGKSSWAATHYRAGEIVSSDELRGRLGTGPADLDASADAFAALDLIVAARARRRLTTVVDTLGLDVPRRLSYRRLAHANGLPAVLVLVRADPATCRRRNSTRDRPVPAAALTGQLRRVRQAAVDIAAEGWDLVVDVAGDEARRPEPRGSTASGQPTPTPQGRPEVILQLSRFDWGKDPAGWLRSVAQSAEQAGFAGIALMDHLIQIPQVGRSWDPIPDPLVTLGLLAGCTRKLRLGTLVSPVTFRPAGILAKSMATLDCISGGRVFCGLGAGWWEREHAAFGLAFPPARERLQLLEQAIETIRALHSPGTKPYAGQHVRLPETTCYPRPEDRIPIIVGGRGARTLRIAARLADGCNVPADPELLDRVIPAVRSEVVAAGRDPEDFAVTVLDTPVIGRDRDNTATQVERLRGRTAAAAFAARHRAGTVVDHQRRYAELADRGVATVFLAPAGGVDPDRIAELAPLAAP